MLKKLIDIEYSDHYNEHYSQDMVNDEFITIDVVLKNKYLNSNKLNIIIEH